MQLSTTLFFLMTVLCGSIMSIAQKYLSGYSPYLVNTVSGLVFGLSSLVLWLWQTYKTPAQTGGIQLHWAMVLLGIAIFGLNVGYSILYAKKVNLSYLPILITACMTIILAVVGHFFFHEFITRKFLVGALLIIAGMGVMTI